MPYALRDLAWNNLARRHFDAARARELVLPILFEHSPQDPGRSPPLTDEDFAAFAERFQHVEEAIDRALVAEFGVWALGWRWTASEPGGGGPVGGWCCALDSIDLRTLDACLATAARAVAALAEWNVFLGELEARFAALATECRDLPLAAIAEQAANRLLPLILERTDASDAWYATLGTCLSWYLESRGYRRELVHKAIAQATSGTFESWIAPEPLAATSGSAAIGRAVASAVADPGVLTDATAAWRSVRERWGDFPFESPRARDPVATDGHARFIDTIDKARDPVRAARLHAALAACRAAAHASRLLDLAELVRWQHLVLGVDEVDFRDRDAFAKGGRECYPLTRDTRAQFEEALAGAADPSTPVEVRAARVYLDVCFFHPFPDGNSRSARLALDHVLTSAGLGLASAEPIFLLSIPADDAHAVWRLAHLISRFAGPGDP